MREERGEERERMAEEMEENDGWKRKRKRRRVELG